MTISPFDTVAAVSTPFGKGGVAVIRLSGDQAIATVSRVFFPVGGKALTDHPYRTAVYGVIRVSRYTVRIAFVYALLMGNIYRCVVIVIAEDVRPWDPALLHRGSEHVQK
jgi:hypothetical protein